MKSSKFKKALSDEMKQEYNSFYSSGEEHIFSPEFEEEMDRLINGKKRKKRLFAVFLGKPAFKYSLSACTALALCAGVLTIWHNHIKDNINNMEDMVVPPTTQTTVSVPEVTDNANGGAKPATTDPTEANTKISQDKTETVQTSVSNAYAAAPSGGTAVTTVIIGPPSKPPVITRISVITGKHPAVTSAPRHSVFPNTLPTTVSTIAPSPTPTKATPQNTGTDPDIGHLTTSTSAPVTKVPVVTQIPVTVPAVTTRSPNVTTRPPLPSSDPVNPTEQPVTRPTNENPGGATPDPCVIVTSIREEVVTSIQEVERPQDGPSGVPVVTESNTGGSEEIDDTDMPHIAFNEITMSYDDTVTFVFNSYINKTSFDNYYYNSSVTTMLVGNNGKMVQAEVHIIKQSGTNDLFLAVHFMDTNTYAFYIQRH